MKYTYFGIGAVLVVVFFVAFFVPAQTTISHSVDSSASVDATVADAKEPSDSKDTAGVVPTQSPSVSSNNSSDDIENQSKLSNPPSVVRALYVTGWVAGISSRVDSLIALAKKANINAFVVDIKDYSGYLSYCPSFTDARSSGACDQLRIKKPNELIKKLHDNNIYVIGRVSVFQDPVQAKAHPEWAIHDTAGGVWRDKKGLAWLEVAAPEVTSYVANIAKDADARGFDEVNFDYVRFPSDGNLSRAVYTQWDKKNPRHVVLKKFFKDIRAQTTGITISADLFGLVTVQKDDLGIGQIIEDAYPYFDFLYPMVYPSHYASGFLGYKNPALYPYEVIKYSMDQAITRKHMLALNSGTTVPVASNASKTVQQAAVDSVIRLDPDEATKPLAKLRPWLQVFDLGADYTAKMVTEQMRATADSLRGDEYAGWLLWDPKVTYIPLRAL